MTAGEGYNATITSGMNNVHEAASTHMDTTHETAFPVMPEHSVVVEHSMATVETSAQVMPEHSVVVEHPMPTVETAAPEHPMLTIVETAAMGHIVGLASTFTRIIVEAHGNTMATGVETAVQVYPLLPHPLALYHQLTHSSRVSPPSYLKGPHFLAKQWQPNPPA